MGAVLVVRRVSRATPTMLNLVTPLMLATLTDRRDFGDDWLLERKLDGERCAARKVGGEVRLEVAYRQGSHLHLPRGPFSGGGSKVPGAPARRRGGGLRRRPDVLHPTATTARRSTPTAEQVAKYPVVYCVFDLLEVDGEDLTAGHSSSGAPGWRRPSGRARPCSTPRPGRATRSGGSPQPANPVGRDSSPNEPTPPMPLAGRRTG